MLSPSKFVFFPLHHITLRKCFAKHQEWSYYYLSSFLCLSDGVKHFFFQSQSSIKLHLTALLLTSVSHLPVFIQLHSWLFPFLFSFLEVGLQAVFPRSSSPWAPDRFAMGDIGRRLEEERRQESEFFSPSLCFNWHLWWAGTSSSGSLALHAST